MIVKTSLTFVSSSTAHNYIPTPSTHKFPALSPPWCDEWPGCLVRGDVVGVLVLHLLPAALQWSQYSCSYYRDI